MVENTLTCVARPGLKDAHVGCCSRGSPASAAASPGCAVHQREGRRRRRRRRRGEEMEVGRVRPMM